MFASKEWKRTKETDNLHLKELIDELPSTLLQAKADNTLKCYSLSWQKWKKWSLEKLGKCELPGNPMHVAFYLQDLIKDAQEKSKSPVVISSAVYGINWAHRVVLMSSPTEHVLVQSVLNASKRISGRPINPKEPLQIEMIVHRLFLQQFRTFSISNEVFICFISWT